MAGSSVPVSSFPKLPQSLENELPGEGYLCLSEVLEGGGFGFEGGDGFDEAGDGEGVADAALAPDQAQDAAFAGQFDGDAHQRSGEHTSALPSHNDIVCRRLL